MKILTRYLDAKMILLWNLLGLIGLVLSVSKPSVIITEYSTHVETSNTSLYHYAIDTSKGLFRLIQNSNDININYNGSEIILLSNYPTNQILHIFAESDDKDMTEFSYLDLNNPKLAYSVDGEHHVTFQESFLSLIEDSIMKDEYITASVAVLVYIECPKTITQYQDKIQATEKSISVACYAIHNDISLRIVKDFIRNAQFTHVWLLLSPLDSKMVLSNLRGTELRNTHIITTMLTHFQFDYFEKMHPQHRLSNIQKQDQQDPFILNITEHIWRSIENMTSLSTHAQDKVLNLLKQSMKPNNLSFSLESADEDEFNSRTERSIVRVSTVIFPPYVTFVPNEVPDEGKQCEHGQACYAPTTVNDTVVWKYLCCDGLSIELFHLLARLLGLTYQITLAPDGSFGAFKNGSWNGMVGQLVTDKADIAIQGLEPTNERMGFVRFTEAYMYTHYVIVRKGVKAKLSIINWKFLQPLEISLLVAVAVSTIATISFLYFSENSKYLFHQKRLGYYFQSREVMTYIFGLTFQRDMGGKNPVNWSGRIAALGYAIAMTIVMTTYSAYITANSITNTGNGDFDGIKDERILEPSPSFKFAVVKDTSQESYFINHPSSKYAQIWSFMKEFSVIDTDEGVLKVYNGELDAFISDDNSILPATSNRKYCSSLTIYNEVRRQSEVTFAYRKDFAYGETMSNLIMKLRLGRVIDNIKQKWIYIPSCNVYNAEDSRFTWMYFGGMLLIIGFAVVVCIVILLIENFYVYIQQVRRRQIVLAK